MGIKGFSVFLNHIGCEWETKSLASYAGKKIAIDGIMYLYQIKLSTWNPAQMMLEFLTRLKMTNITPIFVMDGKYVQEKGQEQACRAQKRQNLQRIIEKIYVQLEYYKTTGEIGQDLAKVVENNPNLFINKLSKTLNTHALLLHLSKLEREVSPIPKRVKEIFLEICDAFNIPVIWAKNDGEMLCALMNKLGLVNAVFSHDSDVFAAGAVSVIKQIDGMTVKALKLQHILKTADLEFSAFRDMCILCGTDFNKRIPGLGPITAYNLIKTHGSIEEIITNTHYNISSINYARVREIYASEDVIPFAEDQKISAEKIAVFIQKHNLQTQYALVEKYWIKKEACP